MLIAIKHMADDVGYHDIDADDVQCVACARLVWLSKVEWETPGHLRPKEAFQTPTVRCVSGFRSVLAWHL